MKQTSLREMRFQRKTKPTHMRKFLYEVNLVVPLAGLVEMITTHIPTFVAKSGHLSFAVETKLRIHSLQQLFNLSDPATKEFLYDTPAFREFAGLGAGEDNLPGESTFLRFCHMLEAHNLSLQFLAIDNATLCVKGMLLKSDTVIDATLISAPSSTKNSSGERDPKMHHTKKGVDAVTGLVNTVVGTATDVNDATQAHALVKGEETDVLADLSYQGLGKWKEPRHQSQLACGHASGKPQDAGQVHPEVSFMDMLEQRKERIRARDEHPFHVIKRQFEHVEVRR